MSPKGAPHPRTPTRRHLCLPGDVAGGLGDIVGTFGDTPTSPKGAPRPYSPPQHRRPSRGRGDPGGTPGDKGGLRRGQSRSQEGLGVLGGGGGGPPRRWRSLEAVGGPRGGPRFSRFLDELTRRVLSPAHLRALGWPPRTSGSPRTLEASWVSGSPRTSGSLPPQGGVPGGGQGPSGGAMEEEEEEEEEDGGQEPGAAGGAGGPRGPPPARAELDALRERMDRLQDDYANSQRLNQLLEERLRGLAQAVALERAALTQRVAEVLQRVLGGPPGTAPPPGTPAAASGRAEDEAEDEEGPLLPPPAFRDPPRP
ncbi:translation initiation factor IF-2-like [Grus americana]|uniref:translation initiation factor IF-2-like n=1 Tax=Grus americana TaxID=9117 RepID=UPI0024083359|nr:translation initiation factor IF-2-like [Grus americana]